MIRRNILDGTDGLPVYIGNGIACLTGIDKVQAAVLCLEDQGDGKDLSGLDLHVLPFLFKGGSGGSHRNQAHRDRNRTVFV